MLYSEHKDQKNLWYVMRALYRAELKTQSRLNESGIRSFVPTKETIVMSRGRKKKARIPVVSNLIFVHSTQKQLAPVMKLDSKFQFIYKKGGMENEPIIVPEKQMEDFINACEHSEKPLYFRPDELNLAKGTKIRIIGGLLNGTEGTLLKVSGARSKRLVVSIPGTLNVAVEVSPDLIEVIEDKTIKQ